MALLQPQLDGTTDPGGLFRRIGILFKMIEDNRLAQITTLDADTTAILEQLVDNAANVEDLDFLPTVERDIYNQRQSRNGWNSQVFEMAKSLIAEHVNATDTLYATDETVVLDYLVRLMKDHGITNDGDDSYVLTRPEVAIAAEVSHYATVGDGHINLTHMNALGNKDATAVDHPEAVQFPDVSYAQDSVMGRPFSHVREETIDFVVTSKSTSDKGTLTKFGYPIRGDRDNYKWPGGSGYGSTIKVCDQTVDATSATVTKGNNVLANSDFEDFDDTADLPDEWTAIRGTPGTTILENTSGMYEGTSNVRFIGTAAAGEDPQIEQRFGNSAYTPGTLKAETKYCLQFWVKGGDASPGTAGNFEVRVRLNGDSWSAYYEKLTTGSFPTTWTRVNLFFNTPAAIATGSGAALNVQVGMQAGGNLKSGGIIDVDFMGLCEVTEDGNLHMAAFNGLTDFALDDRITVPITNDGGDGSEGKFQFYLDMTYGLWEKGVLIEDAVSGGGGLNQINDNLIS